MCGLCCLAPILRISKMNRTELQALRRLLFFTRQEAAVLVAASADRPRGVSDRAWRQWEAGEFAVPDDVARRIARLVEWRQSAIDAAVSEIELRKGEQIALVWYDSLDDWASMAGREPVLWRPQQSVCAALAGEFAGRIDLVRFDVPAYAAWLAGKKDSEPMRGAWAASVTEN